MSGPVVRLSAFAWLGHDPRDLIVSVAYSEREGLWQVRLENGVEEHLDPDLRTALAEAADADVDEPWVIELAGEIEHDLDLLEREDGC
jgi:hypothetical protein